AKAALGPRTGHPRAEEATDTPGDLEPLRHRPDARCTISLFWSPLGPLEPPLVGERGFDESVKSFRDDRRHLLERQGAPTIRAKATSTTKRVARRPWTTARRCGSLHRHGRRPVVTSQTPIAPGKGGKAARSFS